MKARQQRPMWHAWTQTFREPSFGARGVALIARTDLGAPHNCLGRRVRTQDAHRSPATQVPWLIVARRFTRRFGGIENGGGPSRRSCAVSRPRRAAGHLRAAGLPSALHPFSGSGKAASVLQRGVQTLSGTRTATGQGPPGSLRGPGRSDPRRHRRLHPTRIHPRHGRRQPCPRRGTPRSPRSRRTRGRDPRLPHQLRRPRCPRTGSAARRRRPRPCTAVATALQHPAIAGRAARLQQRSG